MRDKEDRVRFSGYDVASFKIFVFCFAAGLAAHRRRDVHPAGRLHVALLRRHRALDRDGDLLRGRRPHLHPRRGLRRLTGELGAHHLLRGPAATVAVRHGRRCSSWSSSLFPDGLAGIYRSRYLDPLVDRVYCRQRRRRKRRPSRQVEVPHPPRPSPNSRTPHDQPNRLPARVSRISPSPSTASARWTT